MTIVSNSDALSPSRDEKSRIADRIGQLGQWIVSTVRRVAGWWTEARLARENLYHLNLVAEAEGAMNPPPLPLCRAHMRNHGGHHFEHEPRRL